MRSSSLLHLLLLPLLTTATVLTLSPLRFTISLSSTTSWQGSLSSSDLDAFSSAAEEYIDGHNLLSSALGLDESQYGEIEFTPSTERRRLRQLQTTDIVLQGEVTFAPGDFALPTDESLSEIVATLFRNGEQLFVRQIVSAAEGQDGALDWMEGVTGYDVSIDAENVQNSSLNLAGVNGVNTKTTDSNSDNMNVFIIIGIAGASISLLILLVGLCYAKRTHNNVKPIQSHTATISPPKKKKSILKNSQTIPKSNTTTTTSLSPGSMPSTLPQDEISDDESNADFLMARAALNNTHSSINPRRVSSNLSAGESVVSGGTSFVDDNMSYAFSVDGQSTVVSRMGGDVAIGAGGIEAFQNESGGVFRWNEDGTKMVYIPAETNNASTEKSQNGFVYDETKKKWVLEQKNVSFQQKETTENTSFITPPRNMTRSRTDDSCVTGFTAFSYDDVAVNREIPQCPSTPQDEGVEVGVDDVAYIDDDVSEFLSNTNVEKFIMDDESTMFGSVMDESMSLPPPPPPRQPPPEESQASPLFSPLDNRPASPDTSMITNVTLEPGVIKRVPVVIPEDRPFDEDIPFDERPKRALSFKPSSQPNTALSRHIASTASNDGSEQSDSSVDSSHVLNDLNKLSKFMTERKMSSKMARSTGSSGRLKNSQQSSTDYYRGKSL